MVCAFCGSPVIVVCEMGLCTGCFGRLEVEAAEFESASPTAWATFDLPALPEDWAW